jgi:site-specific DNA recombinase
MTQNKSITNDADTLPELLEPAAIYARVSSTGQLGRDGDEGGDGYSIPAQVQGCERETEALGGRVVKVYVERAESARSDNRPVLQQMLRELPTLGVKYLIVHKVDRLARNRLDDAQLYEQLVGMGIKLVSATENIDETPAGRLMHGMLATFAEYYSNNLATEIKKGLHQKHKTGGTPFKPPIGYLPKRELIGTQDIRTVIVDPERAPLVQEAFDLYATGDWTLHRLADHLEARGLRSRPTTKRGPQPVSMTSIHKVLRNPYYIGVVKYCGRRVPNGRHPHLVDTDTFDRVQALLAARAIAGDRPYRHQHYLRGTLYCAECGGRLLYGKHRGKGGVYEYFCCINRMSRKNGGHCQTPHFPVPLVEKAVEAHYRTVRLTGKVRDTIWSEVRRDTDERSAVVHKEIERHRDQIKRYEDNQTRLVQLSYEGNVADGVLAREQSRLETEQNRVRALLQKAELHACEIDEALDDALQKTKTPHATYLASNPFERRLLNHTFFKRILVGEESEIVGATLTPVYAALAAWEENLGQPAATNGSETAQRAAQGLERANPGSVLQGRGSHVEPMVETPGIEPGSAVAYEWLLRA